MKTVIAASALLLSVNVAADSDAGVAAIHAGDYETASNELKLLAEGGDVEAQYNLAVNYEQSQGTPQDYIKAIEWYTKAAEQGLKDAQYSLGLRE